MTALEVIRQVHLHDGKLFMEGDVLKVSAPAPLPDNLRQALREHKPAIMVALGAPLDTVISGSLAEIRPHLPQALQRLPDDCLLVLVNWSIIAAWEQALRRVDVAKP